MLSLVKTHHTSQKLNITQQTILPMIQCWAGLRWFRAMVKRCWFLCETLKTTFTWRISCIYKLEVIDSNLEFSNSWNFERPFPRKLTQPCTYIQYWWMSTGFCWDLSCDVNGGSGNRVSKPQGNFNSNCTLTQRLIGHCHLAWQQVELKPCKNIKNRWDGYKTIRHTGL